jgi:hypothetical protein
MLSNRAESPRHFTSLLASNLTTRAAMPHGSRFCDRKVAAPKPGVVRRKGASALQRDWHAKCL